MKTIKHIRLFLGVFTAVAALMFVDVTHMHFVKADENNGNDAVVSHGTGSSEMESENNGNTLSNANENEHEGENSQNSPSLSVNAAGKAVINGASLVSNSGQVLIVKIFGLDVNIAITSSTSLVGVVQGSASSTSSIATMKAGDVIDAKGLIDVASGVITADQVKDETLQQQNVQSIQQQIQALLQQIKALQAQLNAAS